MRGLRAYYEDKEGAVYSRQRILVLPAPGTIGTICRGIFHALFSLQKKRGKNIVHLFESNENICLHLLGSN